MSHSQKDSSGWVFSPTQGPLPDNTQQSQQTDPFASGRIWTHNLSRRAPANLRLTQRGHWQRNFNPYWTKIYICYTHTKISSYLTENSVCFIRKTSWNREASNIYYLCWYGTSCIYTLCRLNVDVSVLNLVVCRVATRLWRFKEPFWALINNITCYSFLWNGV